MNAEGRRITRMDILVFAAVGLLAIVILLSGVQSRIDRYSCHICCELKTGYTSSYYGLQVSRRESSVRNAATRGSTHQHAWWKYGYTYINGPRGWFGWGVVCNARQYRNDQP